MKLSWVIDKVRPNTEWVLYGDDLDGLHFINPENTPIPTIAECEAAWVEVQAEMAAAEAKKIADKQNALAKLANLGLTEDEAKAVIGV